MWLAFHFVGVPGSVKNPYKPLMANSEEKSYNGTKHISKFVETSRSVLYAMFFYPLP